MIYINGKEVKPYVGDYKPLTVYKGTEKLAGWTEQTLDNIKGTKLINAYSTMKISPYGKSEQQQNEVDYPEITMTLDSESGNYYLDGVTTQNGTPSPDNVVDFVNTYPAGTYQTTINDKTYVITLSNDLRSVETTSDRLWLDIENIKAWVIKNIYDQEYTINFSNNLVSDNIVQYYASYNLVKTTGITEDDIVVASNVFKAVSKIYSNSHTDEECIFRGLLRGYSIAVNIAANRLNNNTSISNANSFLEDLGARVYYILETPQTIDQSCYEWNVPSPNNKIDIENVSGDLEVKVLKQNLFMKQGLSTSVDTENFWSNFAYTTPLEDGWCKVEVNNTGTTSAMYANQMIKRGNIDKIKADTNYIIWAEFRNIETNNAGNYANLCGSENISIWTGNVAVPLNAQNKKIIQKVKTKTDISNATLDLRNFVSVTNNSYVTLEYRMMILEDIYTDEELEKITYEEYKEQAVTFPLGEQKLMKDGYLGDDGIHNKRKQIVLDGTEYWSKRSNTNNTFSLSIVGERAITGLCNYYKKFTSPTQIDVKDGVYLSNTSYIIITDLRFTDVTEFKNWLAEQYANGTPVIIEYEVEKEETTPYTQEQQTAYNELQNLKTYRTVTNISNNQNTNMKIIYKINN